MRTSFNLAPKGADKLSTDDADRLIVQAASGEDCLYPPNAVLFPQEGCHTKFTKMCRMEDVPIQVDVGPACVIVYCDNPWSECRYVTLYFPPNIFKITQHVCIEE